MQLSPTTRNSWSALLQADRNIIWTKLRQQAQQVVLILLGATVAALGFALFQIPYDLAAGGVSGIGILISHYTGWPVGTLYLILNIPMMILGFHHLGRWTFVARTLISVFWFSIATDLIMAYIPTYVDQYPLTDDIFLSAVYAGIVGGVGGGLIYRAGATMAGTGVLGRIIQIKTGIPLSQIYLYTDGVIVVAAGFIFGWEIALYAMLTLMLSGMASDYVLEGASRARTATIITTNAEILVPALTAQLGRGVSHWQAVGGYTGAPRTVVMCTVYRPQVTELKRVINEVDPEAFVSIGVTQDVMGRGFTLPTTG